MPQRAEIHWCAYGFVNGNIVLPSITAQLAAGDTGGSLKTQLLGLPIGATLKDGTHTIKISSATTTIDLTGWNLGALTLLPPIGFKGAIGLQVRATTTEAGNGTTATITRKLTVQVLDGTACARPVVVNPYVSYFNNTAVTSTSQGATSLEFSPLVPVASCYAFDAQYIDARKFHTNDSYEKPRYLCNVAMKLDALTTASWNSKQSRRMRLNTSARLLL
jgi:hypothetical protein